MDWCGRLGKQVRLFQVLLNCLNIVDVIAMIMLLVVLISGSSASVRLLSEYCILEASASRAMCMVSPPKPLTLIPWLKRICLSNP